jgi:hypothetical protein
MIVGFRWESRCSRIDSCAVPWVIVARLVRAYRQTYGIGWPTSVAARPRRTAMKAVTWTIRRLTLVAACIGLFALSTIQPAGAEVNTGSDPSSNGTNQVLWCEAMGGTATVESTRTNADGLLVVTVTCSGGIAGSWVCTNVGDFTDCYSTGGAPLPTFGELDPAIGTGNEVLEVVDDGAGTPPPALVADSAKPAADSPRVTAPNENQDQDANTSKGKKSKKGKKGKKGKK